MICFLLSKVRSYYSIIKEPMDFGTMRAKLHEGMYNNLEEFQVHSHINTFPPSSHSFFFLLLHSGEGKNYYLFCV